MQKLKKDVILLHGNCHSASIQAFLVSLPEFRHDYEFVSFPYAPSGSQTSKRRIIAARKALADYAEHNRERIKIVLNGVTQNHVNEMLDKTLFSKSAVIVDHPTPLINFLCPLTPRHGFEDIMKKRPSKDEAEIDTLLAQMKRDGVEEKDLLQRFYETDVVTEYKVDALFTINGKIAQHIDKLSSFPIWPTIENNMRTRQVHTSFGHPAGVVFAEIVEKIGELTGKLRDKENFKDKVALAGNGPGVKPANDIPLHPAIADHFRMDWAKGHAFNYYGRRLTHAEFLIHAYRFMDQELYAAREKAMIQGDSGELVRLYHEKIAKYPEDPHFNDALAEVLLRENKPQEACVYARKAWEQSPDALRGQRLHKALWRSGDKEEGKAFLQRLSREYQDSPAIVLRLARGLTNKKRLEEASALLDIFEKENFLHTSLFSIACQKARIAQLKKDTAEAHRQLEHAYYLKGSRNAILKRLQDIDDTFTGP